MKTNDLFLVNTEETIIKKTSTEVKIPVLVSSIYKDLHKYALSLSPGTPIEFLLFLLTQMDGNNKVKVNSLLIEKYNANLPEQITERSFFRLVKTLVNGDALAKVSRGEYLINPVVVHGRLGISLEMPEQKLIFQKDIPLEDRREYEMAVDDKKPELYLDLKDISTPYPEVKFEPPKNYIAGIDTFEVRDTTKPEEIRIEIPEHIQEALEQTAFINDKMDQLMGIPVSNELQEESGPSYDDIIMPVVEEKVKKEIKVAGHKIKLVTDNSISDEQIILKKPKLNLSGGSKFRS